VDAVASALEALRRVESEAFDVVIADLRMPELSSPHLINRLRHSARRRIPIIVLSSGADEARLGTVNPEISVRKPFRPEALVTAVSALVTR
jgi:CheY-like chemotaxis protein